MIRADQGGAGLAWTVEPESGFTAVITIRAAWGLGGLIRNGSVDPDVYMVYKPVLSKHGLRPRIHPGKIAAGFVMGTRRLFDFIDDNLLTAMLDIAYVNDSAVIRRNPRVTAMNSAIEVDLTGQVCADSIGTRQFSGVGGQMDFIRGASLSEDGKPIIAHPSTTRKGGSKIVSCLKQGAGVVTTRAHVH